jgi:hypothetical protein
MKPQSRLAKVTEINVKSKIKAKKATIIEIKGILGDTGWQFAEERVSIDKNTNVLSISLGIFKKPGMAGLDVITNFVKEINLTFPHKGIWKIQCNKQEIDVEIR